MNLKFFIFILLLQVISYADAMKHFILISFTLFVYSCGQSTAHSGSKAGEMIPSRDTCESPDMDLRCYFRDMPEKLNSQMVIANGGEPGERITIRGRLVNTDGGPVAAAIIYAYHTDRDGIYSKKGNEKGAQKYHGHLHGWCKTDASGNYEIHSIRPAPYPGGSAPAHIHAAILEAGKGPYYINDFVFEGDPLLKGYHENTELTGGTGIIHLEKKDGVWTGTRNIFIEKQ